MSLIEKLEAAEVARLTGERPDTVFAPGDTVRVHFKVVEGARERIQVYEGTVMLVMARRFRSGAKLDKVITSEGPSVMSITFRSVSNCEAVLS